MGITRWRHAPKHVGPLRLPVEPYVHCPRGGLVRLARCEACELMQGSVAGARVEILCAYPEPVPALQHISPTEPPGEGRPARAAITIVAATDPELEEEATSLIFESDWPDS